MMNKAIHNNSPEFVVVGYDNCLASSIALPIEMLSAAYENTKAHSGEQACPPALCAMKRKIACSGSLEVNTSFYSQELETPKLVLLPAIWRNPAIVIRRERNLIEQLKKWYKNGATICAVGSSAALLAEAGLLDQKAATSHWSSLDRFKRQYPNVNWLSDYLITEEDRLYCVSSVNSLADLMIHFVQQFYSADIAKAVERQFSPEVRKSYATSLFSAKELKTNKDEDIARLLSWINDNFRKAIDAEEMANILNVSVRTLNRRFKATVNTSPQAYLINKRLTLSKELLKETNLDIGELASQCGFNDPNYFSKQFKKLEGISPAEYRGITRTKMFSAE